MNSSKLRVVIDIASLGYAHARKEHARGVHRVAQHIVFGLLDSGECDLHFVATSSLAGAYRVLEERGLSPEKMLSYGRGHLVLSRWAERTFRWVERTLPDRRIHLRGLRWLLQRLAAKADASSQNLPPHALRDADIYHSTLSPIPAVVRARNEIRKFLTVVDVIPLTSPETVAGKGVPLLRKQLDSLTPGSFAFCISETVRSELLSVTDLPVDHVFVTPLAASHEAFHPVTDRLVIETTLSAHGIPPEPYFLTLSSFDPRKNFDHVIRCFGRLIQAGDLPGANLLIVGSNPERTTQVERALAEFPSLEGRIIRPGFLPDEDLAAIYSGAIAFLFPSLSEGFGIPLLEAMQCGVPVISSNATAMPEVVGDGGILLPPKDVVAWCAAMKNIWRDKDLREDLARRGLARSAEFSWKRFINATLAGYRTALNSSN